MNVRRTLLGSKYYHYAIYDTALRFFDNSDAIRNEVLYSEGFPENQTQVLRFLESEGLIETDRWGARITEKGRCKRLSGGFIHDLIWERIRMFGTVTAILAAMLAIIVACF